MSARYQCPACKVMLTLASPPEPKFECPGCEKWVTLTPIVAPAVPAANSVRNAPQPVPQRPAAPAADDGFDLPYLPPAKPAAVAAPAPTVRPKWWADRRVKIGAAAGGAVLGLVALVLAFGGSNRPTEQAKADPNPADPPPVVAPVVPEVKPPPPKPPEPKKKALVPRLPDGVEPMIDARPPAKPVGPQEVALAPYPNPLFKIVEPKRVFDQFGNEVGENLGLAHDGEFKGHRILFWARAGHSEQGYFGPNNPLWKALEDKGFVVRREFRAFDPAWLKETEQLWVLSSSVAGALDKRAVAAIEDFVEAGKGLCLLADNTPWLVEASELATRLCGAKLDGNHPGQKIAYVRGRELRKEDVAKYKGDFEVDDHFLLTGVNFLYEGVTISNVAASDRLEVALKASDGKPVLVLSRDPRRRVVIDCGFTRYYYHSPNSSMNFITRTAGTPRLAQNMAAYLAGKGDPKKP